METSGNPFLKLGQVLGCQRAGVPAHKLAFARSFVDTVDSDPTGAFHKTAAACAAEIYKAAGRETDFGFSLFTKIATSDWNPELRSYMDPVYEALAGHQKQAGLWPAAVGMDALSRFADAFSKGAPEALLAGAGLSALAGSSLGALHWKMNRDVDQDDPQLEVMKAKADEYGRIAGDIEHNLKIKQYARGIPKATPARY